MTGPIDESRHTIIRVSEDGTKVYAPKPWRELTADERRTVRELEAIVRWQELLYAKRARRHLPGPARRPPSSPPEQKHTQ